MPLYFSAVGRSLPEATTYVDTRWVLSYNVSVGDGDIPCYTQTRDASMRKTNDFHEKGLQGTGLVAHPLFVWAVEWPLAWLHAGKLFKPNRERGEKGLAAEEKGRAVHYGQVFVAC